MTTIRYNAPVVTSLEESLWATYEELDLNLAEINHWQSQINPGEISEDASIYGNYLQGAKDRRKQIQADLASIIDELASAYDIG